MINYHWFDHTSIVSWTNVFTYSMTCQIFKILLYIDILILIVNFTENVVDLVVGLWGYKWMQPLHAIVSH